MTLVLQWLNSIMLCGINLFKLRKDPLEILLKLLSEIFFRWIYSVFDIPWTFLKKELDNIKKKN